MMGPALPPGAVGQEMLACGLLGGVLGAARAVLPSVLQPDCTVLVKASRGMKLEELTACLMDLTRAI